MCDDVLHSTEQSPLLKVYSTRESIKALQAEGMKESRA